MRGSSSFSYWGFSYWPIGSFSWPVVMRLSPDLIPPPAPLTSPPTRFTALMLALLDAPHAGLQGAAADCLSEVVSKRMDAVPKLTLIESMGIVPRCARWAGGFPMAGGAAAAAAAGGAGAGGRSAGGAAARDDDEDDEGLLVRLARLLATLATEVIDSLKRLENGAGGCCEGRVM